MIHFCLVLAALDYQDDDDDGGVEVAVAAIPSQWYRFANYFSPYLKLVIVVDTAVDTKAMKACVTLKYSSFDDETGNDGWRN